MNALQTAITIRMTGTVPKRRKKAVVMRYPKLLERDYQRLLKRIIIPYTNDLIIVMSEAIQPEIDHVKAIFRDSVTLDEKKGIIHGKIDLMPQQQRDIEESFIRVSRNNKAQFNKGTASKVGLNYAISEPFLLPTLQLFVLENVALIKSLKGDLLESAGITIMSGVAAGMSRKTISGNLQKLHGIGERRADLIGRDQVGKFFGRLTKQRNEEIGIKKFKWITANDSKVRPEHIVLNNETYTWEKGADGLFPGQDINCRCTSTAVLDDIYDELGVK